MNSLLIPAEFTRRFGQVSFFFFFSPSPQSHSSGRINNEWGGVYLVQETMPLETENGDGATTLR